METFLTTNSNNLDPIFSMTKGKLENFSCNVAFAILVETIEMDKTIEKLSN